MTPLEKIEKAFNEKVPGYSMNEYSNEGNKIRPIMVQREDALNFITSLLDNLEKDIEHKFYGANDPKVTDVLSIIKSYKGN